MSVDDAAREIIEYSQGAFVANEVHDIAAILTRHYGEDSLRAEVERVSKELDSWKFMASRVHVYCDEHGVPKPPENEPGIPWRVIRLIERRDELSAEVERLRGLANLFECEIELLRTTLAQTTDTIAQHGEVPEQLKEWRDVLWSTGLSRSALEKGATG